MQLRHLQTVVPAVEGTNKVTAMAWSPNNVKLAVVTVDRVVILFDENGDKQDKFSTKPAESGGPKTYVVKGLAWSPDSCKLAVAQTDKIVFVYKLAQPERAAEWDKKKSICNKFLQTSPVTCLAWPAAHQNTVVYGLVDGKVRMGNLKNNRSQSLYPTGSPCLAIAASPDGQNIVSSHADGKLYRYSLEDNGRQGILCKHPVPVYALAWGETIMAAGSDMRVVFYNENGRVVQHFEHGEEEGESDPTTAVVSPSGQSIVVGSCDRLRVYNYNIRRSKWDASPPKTIENLYTVSALAWKPDGSRLAVGNLCGAVELFECCLKRTLYKGKFDFTYVGPSQVIVTKLATGSRIVLKSHYNYEIEKINVLGNDQYLVGHTNETLLIGDLATCRLSEVPWRFSGNEKFYFENPMCALIFNAGELTVVEYGNNEILGSVRTEHMNPHVLSICIGGRTSTPTEDNKKMAYLIDARTVVLMDLTNGSTIATIEHDAKVDWLELNETGRKLMFRDKRRRLFLFDIATEEQHALLSFCSYVQWVPNSDVIVAQNRNNLCVWYSVDHPERVTSFEIKGDVEDIERVDGRTEVLVDEGVNQVAYTLDEGLIEFGTAVEDGDYVRAVAFLETLDTSSPESKAMWSTLAQLSLNAEELVVAERCYAALGNVAKASYLHRVNEEARTNGSQSFQVRAKMAALNQHFKLAETIYLEQGAVDQAMSMYQTLHQWDQAIAVAESRNLPELHDMRNNYMTWLIETGQEEQAGKVKESEGDLHGALGFYMKAGLPGRAANLVMQHPELAQAQDVVSRVSSALMNASLYETAGQLFERAQLTSRALEAYKKGNVYGRAVELCRVAFPNEVVTLEEQWGDYLVAQKQLDSAIPHFIEAGRMEKAIEAAINARQWTKAAQIVDMQEEAVARPYYKVLAEHFASVRDFSNAKKYYIKNRTPKAAIEMYVAAGKWDEAHKLSNKYMQKEDVADMYLDKAGELEGQHKYKEAEKLYISVDEPDFAINMYKRIRQYDDMVRLIKQYHPDLLKDTHMHLASELQEEGQLAQAETHFVEADDWRSAVNMYRGADMWDDAYRVAKAHGGQNAAQQVAYLWAKSLGGDSAVKLLVKLDMVSVAIDFACDQSAFDFAFELARSAAKERLSDVHLKHAMHLEDEGMFKEAEEEFVRAGKPKEAVLMYVHAQDWDSAQRVAEGHDPDSISDVLVGQARVAFQNRDFAAAETFLLRADRPELAVRYYKEADMLQDALRLATEYVPSKVPEIKALIAKKGTPMPPGTHGDDVMERARMLEASGQHAKAVEEYLKVTPESVRDDDVVEEACEKAAELATKFIPAKAADVVTTACRSLVTIGRYGVAADLFLGIDMLREAVETCMAGNLWDRAKNLADGDDDLAAYVQERYEEHLKETGDPTRLVEVNVIAALDMYAQQRQWERCMAEAEKHGGQVLNKYAALYAADLLDQGDVVHALGVFKQHGAPSTPNNFNLYRKLTLDVLNAPHVSGYGVYADLRDVLAGVCTGLSAPQHGQGVVDEFDRLTRICHYMALKNACKDVGELADLFTKLNVALLRYTDTVPADRAFYEAGMAFKDQGRDNMAFMLLNRFLDLSEAIEEGDLDGLDNTDFVDTDIPFEIPLPDAPSIAEDEREEIKDWVLAVSMDQQIDQVLEKDERGVFIGTLVDKMHNKTYQPCVISGFPILGAAVDMDDGKVASREDWNKFVMAVKTLHNDDLSDVLRFLNTWCGAPANPSYAF